MLSTAYPVGDLVVLFGVFAVLLRGPERSIARVLRIVVAGVALTVVADFAFGYLTLNSESAVRPWLDSLWMLTPLLLSLLVHTLLFAGMVLARYGAARAASREALHE